ncbi:MAG: hypothetical protein PWR10_2213 [Halanaerobiales bacterium]|nr:hypothetical protein [Halanaerobiales bacterium]
MQKILKVCLLLLVLILLFSLPLSAQADIGGELKTTLIGTVGEDGEISTDLQESLDLELFLPEFGNTEAKFQLELFNPPLKDLTGDDQRISVKKLYLRHRFTNLNLTLGRQPISWSFGSLLNPVDFTLGAVAMGEETSGKYVDAVEGYIPFNWNSGLALVAAYPEHSDEIKWGVRGRAGIRGYDLTMNFVREPEITVEIPGVGMFTNPPAKRAGLTFKGDLGPIGAYGAVGYYRRNNQESYVYLLGGDYSYYSGFDKKITFQLEYLSVNRDNLNNILGMNLTGLTSGGDDTLNLLLGNVSYPINDFSSVSLLPVISLDDGSLLLNPTYQNLLGNNLTLTVSGVVYYGDEDTLFGPKEITPVQGLPQKVPKGVLEVGFSYSF